MKLHNILTSAVVAAFTLCTVFNVCAFGAVRKNEGADKRPDKKEIRAGNRKFGKKEYKEAEIDYRRALVKDSSSFAANYNLANTLYRQNNFQEAAKQLESVKDRALMHEAASDYCYNAGNAASKMKQWQIAVDMYKQSLLRNPGDIDAKENYIYARMMLQNQRDRQNRNRNKNDDGDKDNEQKEEDQNQDEDKGQNKDDKQNDDRNRDQNKDMNPGRQPKISPKQAQRLLQAIQAKEKETQDKVKKKKADVLKGKQKEKNW